MNYLHVWSKIREKNKVQLNSQPEREGKSKKAIFDQTSWWIVSKISINKAWILWTRSCWSNPHIRICIENLHSKLKWYIHIDYIAKISPIYFHKLTFPVVADHLYYFPIVIERVFVAVIQLHFVNIQFDLQILYH
jgi:hypothetical protein